MVDILTPQQRSRLMSKIRGKDTKPERVVRRLVHKMGFRYRLHRKDLPGTPDLVFPGRKKVIFVHGCFWHMHDCYDGLTSPKTNPGFWRKKREGNVARDRQNQMILRDMGWSVLVIWECWLKDLKDLERRLYSFLSDGH